MSKYVYIAVSITVFSLLISSCSSLRAGFYLSSIDTNSGLEVLNNEPKVRVFLEEILENPENYIMRIYTRRSIAAKIPKTKLLHHEFYAIYNFENEYHTISFYGTDMKFYSEGAWILDGTSDWGSLQSFLFGENNWEVTEIETEHGINVARTVLRIIEKIDSNVTYYYRDHIKNKPNVDNCVTALEETCIENGKD